MIVCVLPNVAAAADLGNGGKSLCASLSGGGAFSVCGAGATGGNDVSILSVFGFCPDNLRALTEAASFTRLAGVGVI